VSDTSTSGTDRLNEFALTPLAYLHSEGWGPDAVEIDHEAGEVKFVFERALDTGTDRSDAESGGVSEP